MDIQFQGESLFPGQLGQFFIILSFGTALLSCISYFFASKHKDDRSWQKIARIAFFSNVVAVIGIGCCLFYIIYNHLFEYHYAWAHSSRTLPVYYIISSFWEGQEGSFWLWMFWQAVLAVVVVARSKSWESPVMTIIMLCQAVLASMLLGIEVFGERVGSSPFILLRDEMNAPIFSNPNYLSMIADGQGLNPLLQNYWMVIHPPTLFLGFASMIVPFAYGIAGLWQRQYKDWLKPALPWSLFAVMVLGAGIIMGSFWAYEALNFGGFWAWDPVENASIIPWFTLIAAVHVIVAYKNSGHSYFTATFLVLISFVLVIYASFLTRSGVLGETSVHSFTDLGMYWQLVAFNLLFLVIMIYFLISRWKELPITKKDEETYSREFWLFIGALILVVACVQIIATTSIPVFNAMFGTKIAPPVDAIAHYNKWQAAFAILVLILSAIGQFLKYKKTTPKVFYANLLVSVIVAVVVTAILVYVTKVFTNFIYILLSFSAVFALVANARVLGDAFKGKWKLAGSSVAHIGFALLLIGALVAAATNKVVSLNSSGSIPIAGFEEAEKPGENLFLYIDEPMEMDDYTITYVGDSTSGPNTYYKVNYEKRDGKTGAVQERFQLTPNAQQNPKMGLIGTPSTRHYLTKDIYTIITSAPKLDDPDEHDHNHEGHDPNEGYEEPSTQLVNIGDTLRYKNGFIVVKSIDRNAALQNMPLAGDDLLFALQLEVHAANGEIYEADPKYLIKNGNSFDFARDIEEQGLRLRFTKIVPNEGMELMVYQKPLPEKKWVVMKAIEFPYINFFWCGTIIMTIGFLLAILRRNKELKGKIV
ncbi:cytochrome c biogenesis protein CcsA [Olivibacter sp. SDN3]|uniref:heme lyase CcmF/NrfE family subunit n=1 Tax=Olivibacter sp. SDN3 TaxID=2764720 RepID=UPI00165160D3|nr:cytochrome c biogenesis protein CcsA [Olivibacter sp. SDN3]QNL48419.1 cytochrome c biogenesis protein CcsA [Olivibacter sp. SDN3]